MQLQLANGFQLASFTACRWDPTGAINNIARSDRLFTCLTKWVAT